MGWALSVVFLRRGLAIVAQTVLEFAILQPQLHLCWNCRHVPLGPTGLEWTGGGHGGRRADMKTGRDTGIEFAD